MFVAGLMHHKHDNQPACPVWRWSFGPLTHYWACELSHELKCVCVSVWWARYLWGTAPSHMRTYGDVHFLHLFSYLKMELLPLTPSTSHSAANCSSVSWRSSFNQKNHNIHENERWSWGSWTLPSLRKNGIPNSIQLEPWTGLGYWHQHEPSSVFLRLYRDWKAHNNWSDTPYWPQNLHWSQLKTDSAAAWLISYLKYFFKKCILSLFVICESFQADKLILLWNPEADRPHEASVKSGAAHSSHSFRRL